MFVDLIHIYLFKEYTIFYFRCSATDGIRNNILSHYNMKYPIGKQDEQLVLNTFKWRLMRKTNVVKIKEKDKL